MFYRQCNDCGERWEFGTRSTCKCPDEALAEQPAQRIWVHTTAWRGLTDEKAEELVQRFARYELLRAIETELRSKNEDRS